MDTRRVRIVPERCHESHSGAMHDAGSVAHRSIHGAGLTIGCTMTTGRGGLSYVAAHAATASGPRGQPAYRGRATCRYGDHDRWHTVRACVATRVGPAGLLRVQARGWDPRR